MGSSLVAVGGLLCGVVGCLGVCAAVAVWAVNSSKRR
ncbi:hypothetical protein GA0070606_4152 [Micromonospora citrea]|uniref:Uncharacterized protein n=1 Tax=Micromonospora citrea TaxID=47855 RepID=A0A1C6VGN5_9ACTN|nr:hypothetical protein GA0070606_4152 [Micromonospora citrea]